VIDVIGYTIDWDRQLVTVFRKNFLTVIYGLSAVDFGSRIPSQDLAEVQFLDLARLEDLSNPHFWPKISTAQPRTAVSTPASSSTTTPGFPSWSSVHCSRWL
jgi:hypothetical protein